MLTENYPFVFAPVELRSVISDMYVCLNSFTGMPLHLTYIGVNANGLAIVLKDASASTVFQSTLTAESCAIPGYSLYGGTVGNISVEILIRSSFRGPVTTDCVLDMRAVYTPPKHVTSITVNNSKSARHVRLSGGNNIDLGIGYDTSNAIRPATVISITAEPGAGTGLNKSVCTTKSTVKQINGVNSENISMTGTDCYQISAYDHHIYLRNDCTPCCKCSEFTLLAQYLDALARLYYKYGAKTKAVKEHISEFVNQWEQFRLAHLGEVELQVWPVRTHNTGGMLYIVFQNGLPKSKITSLRIELTGSNFRVCLAGKTIMQDRHGMIPHPFDIKPQPLAAGDKFIKLSETEPLVETWDLSEELPLTSGYQVILTYRYFVRNDVGQTCMRVIGGMTATAFYTIDGEEKVIRHAPYPHAADLMNCILDEVQDDTKEDPELLAAATCEVRNRRAQEMGLDECYECEVTGYGDSAKSEHLYTVHTTGE